MLSINIINEISNLNTRVKTCDQCQLSSGRTNAVCGEGNVHAKFLFIAQAPGEWEDREGKLFIGPTGKVMDELFRL